VTDVPAIPLPEGLGGAGAVTVMWRPGCPFCAMLLRGLERTGLQFDRIDIWEEPDAAAWVRAHADGNETVPTVRIAGDDPDLAVALVNPSTRQVLEVLERLAPQALPLDPERSARVRGRLSALVGWGRLRGRRDRDRGHGARR